MDEGMILTVGDMVISDLITMYGDQPTFNADKISIIVQKVVNEVISARRYKEEKYTDMQIEQDLHNYRSQIYNLSEYDFSQFGAPHETSHGENGVSRSFVDRNKLFAGIVPLSHF